MHRKCTRFFLAAQTILFTTLTLVFDVGAASANSSSYRQAQPKPYFEVVNKHLYMRILNQANVRSYIFNLKSVPLEGQPIYGKLSLSRNYLRFDDLPEANYQVRGYYENFNGTMSYESSSFNFTVDRSAPKVKNLKFSQTSFSPSRGFNFNASGEFSDLNPITWKITLRKEGGQSQIIQLKSGSTKQFNVTTSFAGTPDGKYQLEFTATDSLGHRYHQQVQKLMIDRTPPQKPNQPKKPFGPPLMSIQGVNQWHGYTKYSSPHTGIDFRAHQQPVISVGDGIVVLKEWDSYGDRCNSGGNILKIKHDNGMSSVYMHLESYKKFDGKDVKIGERVKRGQQIAVSGNSGQSGCKPIRAHLHLEIYTGQNQKSHVDPVKYIDLNWSKIQSVGDPSGNNPNSRS